MARLGWARLCWSVWLEIVELLLGGPGPKSRKARLPWEAAGSRESPPVAKMTAGRGS